MQAALPDALRDALRDRPPAPLVVGFSGGLDSSVLLQALARDTERNHPGLRAVHVHHGLHPAADDWAAHCTRACGLAGVPLEVVRVSVTAAGQGPEAAAREARYGAFAAALGPDEVLALGHHLDDQAETLLLRALRGSGVDGLAAIRRWRPFAAGHLWRPMLHVPREILRDYANRHRLSWVEDPSNAECGADRNFLRNEVMPLLRRRWPHAPGALARSAGLCGEAADLLADADDAQLAALSSSAGPAELSRSGLLALPAERRARLLRGWVVRLGLPPLPATGVARLEAEVLPARADAGACFRWGGAVVRAWRDRVHAGRDLPGLPRHWSQRWDGSSPLALPDGGVLSLHGAAALPAPVTVHARRGGERIHLPRRAHSHALKHVLQELGVAPWRRAHLPLLTDDGGQLLAVADLAWSGSFAPWLQASNARLHWRAPLD